MTRAADDTRKQESNNAWLNNAHARFHQNKNGRPQIAGKCWISATERFQRKPKFFDLRCPLARVRDIDFRHIDRHTDRHTTVTLAAHARRGLVISVYETENDCTVHQSLREYIQVHNVSVYFVQGSSL